MKTIFLFILSSFSVCTAQVYDDSTGWVQPWLNSVTGTIEGMNVNYLDLGTDSPDTIFLGIIIEYSASPGVTFTFPGDTALKVRLLGGIDAYAVKERRPLIGQAYHIYDKLRRPIESLLSRGARIWKIQKTGQK